MCIRDSLYADAANATTKLENGFDLSDYDERALKFAYDPSAKPGASIRMPSASPSRNSTPRSASALTASVSGEVSP